MTAKVSGVGRKPGKPRIGYRRHTPMETTNRPGTPLPWRAARMEGGRRLALVNKDGGLITYLDCQEDRAAYLVHAANAYSKLMEALRSLWIAARTRPVFSGDGVNAVREAGKFMKALEEARAVLDECEEGTP